MSIKEAFITRKALNALYKNFEEHEPKLLNLGIFVHSLLSTVSVCNIKDQNDTF